MFKEGARGLRSDCSASTMNTWDLACIVRFQAFPFIEDSLKRRPIRYILEMDVQHAGFQAMIKPSLETNQFVRFTKQLAHVRHKRWIHVPVHIEQDMPLIEELFWEEHDEALAKRILQVLLTFPTHRHPTIWRSGTNLLLRATQTCELRHTSEHPVRQGERDTVNVKQSQSWLSRQTMLSGDNVATHMSGATQAADKEAALAFLEVFSGV